MKALFIVSLIIFIFTPSYLYQNPLNRTVLQLHPTLKKPLEICEEARICKKRISNRSGKGLFQRLDKNNKNKIIFNILISCFLLFPFFKGKPSWFGINIKLFITLTFSNTALNTFFFRKKLIDAFEKRYSQSLFLKFHENLN